MFDYFAGLRMAGVTMSAKYNFTFERVGLATIDFSRYTQRNYRDT